MPSTHFRRQTFLSVCMHLHLKASKLKAGTRTGSQGLPKSLPGPGQFLNLQPVICGWVSTSDGIQVLKRECNL